MKTGLFFDCGRSFIILPQKSVPSLLKAYFMYGSDTAKINVHLSDKYWYK